MSLTEVRMSEDVFLTCLTHALSTQTEEIMGLLLGDIEHAKNGGMTAIIWGASPQPRADRRKDRVETNPEQLAAATALADRMTVSIGRTTRVIGWYHSHPRITVHPSHVDVRTQGLYQLLDSGFIGLIFSCFNDKVCIEYQKEEKVGTMQVIAFQSTNNQNLISKPLALSPINRNTVGFESSLNSFENALSKSNSLRMENAEEDTGDSRITLANKGGGRSSGLEGFFANADANSSRRDRDGEGHHFYNSETSNNIIDLMDTSESMQEALHRSNLDVSGAEYSQKEIPLHVLPTSYLTKLESPLTSYMDLQHMLFEEERTAYKEALSQNMRDGKVHPLTFVHHTSTYQASLCKLIEYCLSPAINMLQDRLRENEIRLSSLIEEAKTLEMEASRGSDTSSGSPHQAPSQAVRGSHPFGRRDSRSPEPGSSRGHPSPGSRSRKGST